MAFTYLIAFVPGWVAAQLFAAAGLPVLSAMFHFLSLVSSSQQLAPQVQIISTYLNVSVLTDPRTTLQLAGTRSLWTWANLGRKLKDHKGWLYRCTHEWRKGNMPKKKH